MTDADTALLEQHYWVMESHYPLKISRDGSYATGSDAVEKILAALRQIPPEGKIPADNFVGTLAANVDNPKLRDADFRQIVRNTLPIIHLPE